MNIVATSIASSIRPRKNRVFLIRLIHTAIHFERTFAPAGLVMRNRSQIYSDFSEVVLEGDEQKFDRHHDLNCLATPKQTSTYQNLFPSRRTIRAIRARILQISPVTNQTNRLSRQLLSKMVPASHKASSTRLATRIRAPSAQHPNAEFHRRSSKEQGCEVHQTRRQH